MGDAAEPFREANSFQLGRGAASKELYGLGDPNSDVGVCPKPSSELGSFNFDMGDHGKAFHDGTDVSCAASHGVKAFFALSDDAKAFCKVGYEASCTAGDDADAVWEEDDGSMLDWVSPRISFSQDLAMEEPLNVEASRSGRSFPEKRKWQEGENGEPDDGCSSDFEFSNEDVACGGFSISAKDLMLSADELFLDGKLLPMHTQQIAPPLSASYGDIGIHRSKLTLQGCNVDRPNMEGSQQRPVDGELLHTQQEASSPAASYSGKCVYRSKLTMPECDGPNVPDNHPKPVARHLSLDLPKPMSLSNVCELAPLASLSVDNSPCSSPPRTSSPPHSPAPVASSTPVSHKVTSKYTFKIKDLFKPKRMGSSVNAQLTRDNSTSASTCRIPIPPRSFWPFSRSNSAGESKTTTPPPPTLPPRSNSTGESNTSRVSPACKSSCEVQRLEQSNTSSASHTQDPIVSGCEDAENLSNAPIYTGSLNQSTENSKQANEEEESIRNTEGTSQDGQQSNISNKGRLSGSPGRASRKKYMYTSSNFLRGSPGRRGGMHSFVKMNTSRIILRNLERCSAERKFCRESSGRRAPVAYPVALRVSPVLNVAVYRGKMPSSGMFGLRSLFSSKKNKTKGKEAPVNNWRVGA